MVHGTVEGPASSQPSSALEAEESTRFIEIPRSVDAPRASADRDLLGMLAPAELTLRMSPAAKRGIAVRPMLPPHDAGELTRIGLPRPPVAPVREPPAAIWPSPESLCMPPEPMPATPRVVALPTPVLPPGTLLAEPSPVTVRDPLSHARAQDAHYGRWAAGFLLSLGALFIVSLFVPHGARRAEVAPAAAPPVAEATYVPVPAAPPAFTLPTAVVVTADFAAPPPDPKAAHVPPQAVKAKPASAPAPRAAMVAAAPRGPGPRVADARTPKIVPMTPAEIEQFKRDPHGYMKHLEP